MIFSKEKTLNFTRMIISDIAICNNQGSLLNYNLVWSKLTIGVHQQQTTKCIIVTTIKLQTKCLLEGS